MIANIIDKPYCLGVHQTKPLLHIALAPTNPIPPPSIIMNITQLTQATDRNAYGDLNISFEQAIGDVYPEVEFSYSAPSSWGHNGAINLNGNTLTIPSGQYKSKKHHHTAGHGILAIEGARQNHLNLRGCPLFLLKGYGYNGDYKSLSLSYYLFGRNEDGSFFLHRVRPKVAKDGNLDQVRAWIWSLKNGEKIAKRQGDVAFIQKARPAGSKIEATTVRLGNHTISGTEIRQTANKTYVLNPTADHHEHMAVALTGWHEVRPAKAWAGGNSD
jgi:hypothetical protein